MSPISPLIAGRTGPSGTVTPVTAASGSGARDTHHGPDIALPAVRGSGPSATVNEREAPSGRFSVSGRPQAALVAHLIATRMGLPQTRALRRAAPDHAGTAYRQARDLDTSAPARRDRRV